MDDVTFNERVKEILKKDSRYSPEAYTFVGMAVNYAVKLFSENRKNRHVSGRELLQGLSDLAKKEYGPFAYEVLKGWGITDDKSIGQIVFYMLEYQLLSKSENDKIEDFNLGLSLKDILGVDDSQPEELSKNKEDIIIE